MSRLAGAVRWVVVGLTGIMLAALSLQIGARSLFGQVPSWTEELALACFTWTMLLAIALGVRDLVHVRMDLLVDALPSRWAAALERLVHLAIAGLAAFLAWAGARYAIDAIGTTSAAIGYPTVYLYAAAPVSALLIGAFAIERAIVGRPPDAASTATDATATATATTA